MRVRVYVLRGRIVIVPIDQSVVTAFIEQKAVQA